MEIRIAGIVKAVSYTHLDVYKRQDLHKVAQTLCKDAGFTPWSILENRSIAAAHHMVLAGIGVSFMPYSLVRYGNFAEHPYYYYLENSRPKDVYKRKGPMRASTPS